jgi:hypothetical protein
VDRSHMASTRGWLSCSRLAGSRSYHREAGSAPNLRVDFIDEPETADARSNGDCADRVRFLGGFHPRSIDDDQFANRHRRGHPNGFGHPGPTRHSRAATGFARLAPGKLPTTVYRSDVFHRQPRDSRHGTHGDRALGTDIRGWVAAPYARRHQDRVAYDRDGRDRLHGQRPRWPSSRPELGARPTCRIELGPARR